MRGPGSVPALGPFPALGTGVRPTVVVPALAHHFRIATSPHRPAPPRERSTEVLPNPWYRGAMFGPRPGHVPGPPSNRPAGQCPYQLEVTQSCDASIGASRVTNPSGRVGAIGALVALLLALTAAPVLGHDVVSTGCDEDTSGRGQRHRQHRIVVTIDGIEVLDEAVPGGNANHTYTFAYDGGPRHGRGDPVQRRFAEDTNRRMSTAPRPRPMPPSSASLTARRSAVADRSPSKDCEAARVRPGQRTDRADHHR